MASDNQYALATRVLISSIALATSKKVKTELIINFAYQPRNLSQENISRMHEICKKFGLQLKLHPYESEIRDEDIFGGEQKIKHISSTTLAKFYFFETMMEPFLWLDTDIAVRTGWEKVLGYEKKLTETCPYIVAGLEGSESFNAGVLGCLGGAPIADWKTRIGTHYSNVEQHIFVDELKEKSIRVPMVFNTVSIWGSVSRTKESLVVHSAGPIKPWHLQTDLWSFCKISTCGWHTWYLAAEHLAKFDTEMKSYVDGDLRPGFPRNSSWRARMFLRIINLKWFHPLIPAVRSVLRVSRFRKGSSMHPMCIPES